jgi:hypothetical protein
MMMMNFYVNYSKPRLWIIAFWDSKF